MDRQPWNSPSSGTLRVPMGSIIGCADAFDGRDVRGHFGTAINNVAPRAVAVTRPVKRLWPIPRTIVCKSSTAVASSCGSSAVSAAASGCSTAGGDHGRQPRGIIVADTGNHRLQVFNLNGVPAAGIRQLRSGNGQLNQPTAVTTLRRREASWWPIGGTTASSTSTPTRGNYLR